MLQINIFVANEQTVGYCKKCYGWKKLLHINLKKVQQLDGKNKKNIKPLRKIFMTRSFSGSMHLYHGKKAITNSTVKLLFIAYYFILNLFRKRKAKNLAIIKK